MSGTRGAWRPRCSRKRTRRWHFPAPRPLVTPILLGTCYGRDCHRTRRLSGTHGVIRSRRGANDFLHSATVITNNPRAGPTRVERTQRRRRYDGLNVDLRGIRTPDRRDLP